MPVLGEDLGFGQNKGFTGKEQFKFPSVVGQPSVFQLKDDINVESDLDEKEDIIYQLASQDEKPSDEQDIVIEYNNNTYYVGKKAIEETKNATISVKPDKTDRDSDTIKHLAILGYALRNADVDKIANAQFTVVSGLPVYELADLQDKLKANLSGTFEFKYNGRDLVVNVPKVYVIPQSAGAYYDLILNEKGEIVNKKLATGKVTVIDIGYRTTDVITMLKSKYQSEESFTIFSGVSKVHQEVRKMIHKEHGMNKKPTQMDQIIRSRKIKKSGQWIDIGYLIDKAISQYAIEILEEIIMYIPDHKELDQLVITGGGVNVFLDAFKQEYGDALMVMSDPEFSNARGYYKYGRLLERKS